jgi:hypothetical protein
VLCKPIPQGKEVVSSILGYEISSLPHGKLAKWSIASCALTLASMLAVCLKKIKNKKLKKIQPVPYFVLLVFLHYFEVHFAL